MAEVALVPRDVLFGNPDKIAPVLSPDGTKLAYLAPHQGALNVWVGPAEDPTAAQPVTDDDDPIFQYFWAHTNNHILYLQDEKGDENNQVYAVDLASGETRNLTPIEGVAAGVQAVSHRLPRQILVGLNDRNPQFHDVYRVDIVTGERQLVLLNEEFAMIVTDDDYNVRIAGQFQPSGGLKLVQRADDGWQPWEEIPHQDSLTTSPLDFDKSGKRLFMLDSRERNTSALVAVDLETGERKVLSEDQRADAGIVLRHPTEKNVQAVSYTYDRRAWDILDPAVEQDFAALSELSPGELNVASRSLDDRRWVVAYVQSDGPVAYYLWDRDEQKGDFLFTNRDELTSYDLAPMRPEVIESRDGLDLVSYLTLPVGSDPDGDGRPEEALAMVLLVHGGPWGRDSWGLHPYHQLLANRGYAVLAVNFRGSTGIGKDFTNAGDLEWGRKMHDDLIDGVNWAVAQGIALKDRVAIMGGSYGGYATLVGVTMTPDVFAAGVDIVGPSNLITLLESIPPYWVPIRELFTTRMGDPSTEEGRALLVERSPLTHVGNIKSPLLIGQGANDPRVKQAESDQIASAMKEKGIPVTYVLFPDEGHGFALPENNKAFFAVTELFLAEHLGGRAQPVTAADFEGSSLEVLEGVEGVAGLAAALSASDTASGGG